jgi:flagellar hook-associated protein 1 FlgK
MSGILTVASRALMANQTVLQTVGNNIANVNTTGYSRQTAVLTTVPGQYTGSGYIGKGVDVSTIERSYDDFLNRQASLSSATSTADSARASKMALLENMFPTGTNGLGAAISDMLNAFSDVAAAPTDLTARSVALTKVTETAQRISSTSQQLNDLQSGLQQEMTQKIAIVNTLAASLAKVNDRIAKTQGSNQSPNDLLDQRDQLVRQINQYVQTSTVHASDGTTSVFIGGSQALVLGNTVGTLSLSSDDFGDAQNSKLALTRNGQTQKIDDAALGGGEISGLIRFQNSDMADARNLLGRLTTVVTTSMNDQHKLGLDLDGNAGGNLFTPVTFGAGNILQPVPPATTNTGSANLSLSVSDLSKLVPSNYQVAFTGASAGTVTRLSDNTVTNFSGVPITVDGLQLDVSSGSAAAGDRFLIKPYANASDNVSSAFSSPRALAVASPVAGLMGSSNTGSLKLGSLQALSMPISATPVTLTFTGSSSYMRSDVGGTFAYTPGQAITGGTPSQWSLTLQGTPQAADTFTVQQMPAAYRNQDAGNANAMMNLRDAKLIDGSALTDGYASLIAQVGTSAQSAKYAAQVSSTTADNLEKQRTAATGVNLDEEASKLLQYQQAYQASAKVIQVAQSIFDTMIQTLGR